MKSLQKLLATGMIIAMLGFGSCSKAEIKGKKENYNQLLKENIHNLSVEKDYPWIESRGISSIEDLAVVIANVSGNPIKIPNEQDEILMKKIVNEYNERQKEKDSKHKRVIMHIRGLYDAGPVFRSSDEGDWRLGKVYESKLDSKQVIVDFYKLKN